MNDKMLVEHKCARCDESIITEERDAMLECAGHLFDKHKGAAWSNSKEYLKQFPNGSFIKVIS